MTATLEPETCLFWCKNNTENYVAPVGTVHLRIKDPSRFGMTIRGPDGQGAVTEMGIDSVLENFKPTVLEIIDAPNPAEDFFVKLERNNDGVKRFFSNLSHIKVSGNPNFRKRRLLQLIRISQSSLKSIEFSDSYSTEEIEEIIDVLASTNYEGIEISHNFQHMQLDSIFKKSKGSPKAVRFTAPPGMNLAELLKCTESSSGTKLAAFHELSLTDPSLSVKLSELDQFIGRLFPRLEWLFLDWNVIDTEIEINDSTKAVIESLAKLLEKSHVRGVFILIYAPTIDHQNEAEKIVNIYRNKHKFNVELHPFGTKGSDKDNFALVRVGKTDTLSSVERKIINLVALGRNTLPGIRELLFAIDESADESSFKPAALTLEFGGFNNAEVRRKANATSEIEFVADEAQNRFLNSSA